MTLLTSTQAAKILGISQSMLNHAMSGRSTSEATQLLKELKFTVGKWNARFYEESEVLSIKAKFEALTTKPCFECGALFQSHVVSQRYCCKTCAKKGNFKLQQIRTQRRLEKKRLQRAQSYSQALAATKLDSDTSQKPTRRPNAFLFPETYIRFKDISPQSDFEIDKPKVIGGTCKTQGCNEKTAMNLNRTFQDYCSTCLTRQNRGKKKQVRGDIYGGI